eukprot:TRINITY_DN734_c1_g1_i2.p1 TRINITY_DN734_c1_g1~~TRINITY_DN734_c1_g1_i2.p1  ORF type:complete len:230 (+),score=62.37 TRINITY_DN734_c1_g1_i2:1207-1896(+)
MEKLSLVKEQMPDGEGLDFDIFVKLERELRKKLELPETKVQSKQEEKKRTARYFEDSKVIESDEERKVVVGWLKEVRGEGNVNKVELLFRGSRDGFRVQDFHSRCDNQGPTIVVFKTSEGRRGGGYTSQQWASPTGLYQDVFDPTGSSFLFSLESKEMFKHIPEKGRAICNQADYGPFFGNGNDLYIETNCNQNQSSSSNPGSYSIPSSASLVGSFRFRVLDYEVWKVI